MSGQALGVGVGPGIQPGRIGQQGERIVEVAPVGGVVGGEDGDLVLQVLQLFTEPSLLARHDVQIEHAAQVGVGQTILRVIDFLAFGGERFQFGFRFGHQRVVPGVHQAADRRPPGCRDHHVGILGGHQMLDFLDPHSLEGAVRLVVLPSGAHEVRVDRAGLRPSVDDDQPRLAPPAIHQALQDVVMNLRPVDG